MPLEDGQNSSLVKLLFESPLTWLGTGGGLTLIVSNIFARRKANADAKSVDAGAEVTLSQGALGLVAEMRQDMNRHQERIDALENENRTLFRRVAELEVSEAAAKAELIAAHTKIEALEAEISRLRGVTP